MYIRNDVTQTDIANAEQVLIDNGIDRDEAETVLQALGYVLLDEELYPGSDPAPEQPKQKKCKKLRISDNEDPGFLSGLDVSRTYTPNEIYHFFKDKYTEEDVRSKLDEYLENNEYDIPDDVAKKLPATLVKRFNKALSMNDTYWEVYWYQIDSVIEDAIEEYKESDNASGIGSQGFCVKSYIEDDIVNTSDMIEDFENAVQQAMRFDCDAFLEEEESHEYEDSLGYEPSCLVSVVDIATGTTMFWANTDGDFGSDYDGDDYDNEYNTVIDKYMHM